MTHRRLDVFWQAVPGDDVRHTVVELVIDGLAVEVTRVHQRLNEPEQYWTTNPVGPVLLCCDSLVPEALQSAKEVSFPHDATDLLDPLESWFIIWVNAAWMMEPLDSRGTV